MSFDVVTFVNQQVGLFTGAATDLEVSDALMANFSNRGRPPKKNMMISGFGVNDAPYATQQTINGKVVKCPAYSCWKNMIDRVHSESNLSRRSTYCGVSVCDEWSSFMGFRRWWVINQVDGWHLDKDILSPLKIYSPDSCIFIPPRLNAFVVDCGKSRGDLPIGVHRNGKAKNFRAQCRDTETRKKVHLGYFSDALEASSAWRSHKLSIAASMREMMDKIDSRIYVGVVRIVNEAK